MGKALQGEGDKNGDGQISVKEIFKTVQKKFSNHPFDPGEKQEPQLFDLNDRANNIYLSNRVFQQHRCIPAYAKILISAKEKLTLDMGEVHGIKNWFPSNDSFLVIKEDKLANKNNLKIVQKIKLSVNDIKADSTVTDISDNNIMKDSKILHPAYSGFLIIESNPVSDTVFVNSKPLDISPNYSPVLLATPLKLRYWPVGDWDFKLKSNGYNEEMFSLTTLISCEPIQHPIIELQAKRGHLYVKTNVSGITVQINGEDEGYTNTAGEFRKNDLIADNYKIHFIDDNNQEYQEQTIEINIKRGELTERKVNFKKSSFETKIKYIIEELYVKHTQLLKGNKIAIGAFENTSHFAKSWLLGSEVIKNFKSELGKKSELELVDKYETACDYILKGTVDNFGDSLIIQYSLVECSSGNEIYYSEKRIYKELVTREHSTIINALLTFPIPGIRRAIVQKGKRGWIWSGLSFTAITATVLSNYIMREYKTTSNLMYKDYLNEINAKQVQQLYRDHQDALNAAKNYRCARNCCLALYGGLFFTELYWTINDGTKHTRKVAEKQSSNRVLDKLNAELLMHPDKIEANFYRHRRGDPK